MSTAVIICGQARTFAKCWPTQYWYVYRKLVNPTFYVAVEDDEQAPDMARIYERFGRDRVHLRLLPRAADCTFPNPPNTNAAFAPYPVMTPTRSIMKCFWNYGQAWQLMLEREPRGTPHNIIVRTRPDAYFHDFRMPVVRPAEHDFISLWWERYGGVNDRICVMGRRAAEVHMTMTERVDAILAAGAPLHGESFVAAALDLGGMRIRHTLDGWLSLKRLDGRVVSPGRLLNEVPPPPDA